MIDSSEGLVHLEFTSSYHSFESITPVGVELYDHRTETTIGAIIDLNDRLPRLLAVADHRYQQSRLDSEEFRELMNDARWPENMRDDREMEVDFDREIRIGDGGESLFIDDQRFELKEAPIFFPLRGDDDDHLRSAFIAP